MVGFIGPAAGKFVDSATNKFSMLMQGPAAGKMVGKGLENLLFRSGLRPANVPYIYLKNDKFSSFATVYPHKMTLKPLVLNTF